MIPLVTFVVPVRHPENCIDWNALQIRLSQTTQSIAAQTNDRWRAIVIANAGAKLPLMPPNFAVERVDFPPNALYDMGKSTRENVYDAVRLDKGRRILKGMLAAPSEFFMVVDDDDFVSAGIVEHVSRNRNANGWKIDRGYLWTEGGKLMLTHNDFSNLCGTSLIVRADLYGLPERFEEARDDYVKSMLGSHIKIAGILADRGTPLAALPFPGAIYRVGHSGAHSQSAPLRPSYFLNKATLFKPRTLIRNIFGLRLVDHPARREFFGGSRI